MVYEGYLSNAEDDVEGAIPVIIKTVKGECQREREREREREVEEGGMRYICV